MAQLDALQLTDALRSRMVDFAADDNFVRDDRLARIAHQLWSGPAGQGGLISDLWVEGAFPSKASPVSLSDLSADGRFDPRLRDVLHQAGAVPGDRPLYTHQLEAIERARSGAPGQRPAIVVTAGTGAGKTESFLLPILDDLYRNPPTQRRGARCIILYPMNALVNDQMERLYGWLKGQQDVTLFHFTSETPEDKRAADDQGVDEWEPCRMRTRQQARGLESRYGQPVDGGPTPDIVITNYSMLEYMLCRPQDAVFFGPDLRAIVLDEAHLYAGTLAAEITLLLRRLLLRCGLEPEDVTHFATSATLGTGEVGELQKFAAQVFSKPQGLVDVIAGESARTQLDQPSPPDSQPTPDTINSRQWLDSPTIVDNGGQPELAVSDVSDGLREDLAILVSRQRLQTLSPAENRPAVLLHHSLSAAPLVWQMHDILWDQKRVPLAELAERVFGCDSESSVRATVRLMQLAASARTEPGAYPLVPHRIHVMARSADCLTICLNNLCCGAIDGKLPPLGLVSAGYQDTCVMCGSRTLSLERCKNCGQWLLAGQEQGDAIIAALPRIRREEEDADSPPERRLFHPTEASDSVAYFNPTTGDIRGSGASDVVQLYEHRECPNCQAEISQIASFYSGAPLTLSVLAETLLADLPEFPAQAFGNDWLPAKGRRLLAFSDSRREAARLGPLLTSQHEQQLVRAAIVAALGDSGTDAVAAYERGRLESVEEQLRKPNLDSELRRHLERDRTELQTRLAQLEVGGAVSRLVDAISGNEILAQIIDRPASTDHIAGEWGQQKWEDNRREVNKRIREFLGRELASPIRRSVLTLESAGLVEVTYPGLDRLQAPAHFIGVLPTEDLRQTITEHWTDLLAALCDTMRTDGVVTLSQDLDEIYAFGGMLIGRWAAAVDVHSGRGRNGLERFVGATQRQRRRQFAAAVLRNCGLPEEQEAEYSEKLLLAVFEQLLDAAKNGSLGWLEFGTRETQNSRGADAIRIKFFDLGLRRPTELFRCRITGHVWPRSVAGCAPESGCEGTLEAAAADALDQDPRLGRRRREFRESPIFKMGLWAEEHSAQLDPKENRRLQDLFKAGIRNILSSTTTLELGIDIGGLNGVLMSNVPPGKSNYLQRAGRAGRRADGSSIVTTFARPRPYDREVFQRIGDYLDTPLRPPVVFLDRERVVRRHVYAFLLGEFFQQVYGPGHHTGAMDAFGSMGGFCAAPETRRWEARASKPQVDQGSGAPSLREQFRDYLAEVRQQHGGDIARQVNALLSVTDVGFASTNWADFLDDVATAFDEACAHWQADYDALLVQWAAADNARQANALHYQLRLRRNTTVIEALADRQFLPSYGFPIGVLKLRVTRPDENNSNRIREEDQFRLERQGLLALREYVPGSELLAGGQLVTSHGILKHWTGLDISETPIGLRGQYTRCTNDHFYYWGSDGDGMNCPFCHAPAKGKPVDYIVPQYGFSGATWDPPKWSTATPEVVGEVETVPASFTVAAEDAPRFDDLGGIPGLSAHYREDGELLVYNEGDRKLGFAVCLQCGYSASEREIGEGHVNLPPGFAEHIPLNARRNNNGQWVPPRCWRRNQAHVLRRQTLAARETTDVLLLDFSGCLNAAQQNSESLIATLGYALQRAAAELLQLDGRELGVATMPTGAQSCGVLLYDNVPGGAGHVRELLAMGRPWLEWAKAVLFIDGAHDRRCRSACLDCLLSFQTQNAMRRGLLNRPQALSVLSKLL